MAVGAHVDLNPANLAREMVSSYAEVLVNRGAILFPTSVTESAEKTTRAYVLHDPAQPVYRQRRVLPCLLFRGRRHRT